MMFAEAATNPNDTTAIWVAVVSCAASIAALITTWARKSERREVSIVPDAVTKAELAQVQERLKWLTEENTKVWVKMEGDRVNSIDRAGKLAESLSGLSAKLDAVCNSASLLALRMDSVRKQL
jgi:hypothetical protein